jgi:hypothetical protein
MDEVNYPEIEKTCNRMGLRMNATCCRIRQGNNYNYKSIETKMTKLNMQYDVIYSYMTAIIHIIYNKHM